MSDQQPPAGDQSGNLNETPSESGPTEQASTPADPATHDTVSYPVDGSSAHTAPQEAAQGGQPGAEHNYQGQAGYDPNAYAYNQYAQQADQPTGSYDPNAYAAAYGQNAYTAQQYVPPAPKEKKPMNKALLAGIAAGAVAGLLFGLIGVAVGVGLNSGKITSSGAQFNPGNPEALSPRADGSVAAIAKAVLPTTVTVIAQGRDGSGGTGSGFVYNSDGYILTNNHVVAEAASGGEVAVRLPDQTQLEAKVVGRSVSYDVAVIKVSGNLRLSETLTPSPLATPRSLLVHP